jgi:curved DNA-binding protein
VKNYYQILGIAPDSSADNIKRAYRKLASQHHPDKGGDTARFQEIQEAYAVLSDAGKRAAYDRPQPSFTNSNGFDFDAIFNMFGANLHQQRRPSPRIELWIDLADVYLGGPRMVALQLGNSVSNIEILIPRGIHDQEGVRYNGIAPSGHDLIVIFRVKPNLTWRRDGNNIITEHTVDIWDLILGSNVKIKDLAGNELMVTISPETQPGAVLRARGKGLPDRRHLAVSGDLLIRLQATIPTPVPEDVLSAIRKIKGQ